MLTQQNIAIYILDLDWYVVYEVILLIDKLSWKGGNVSQPNWSLSGAVDSRLTLSQDSIQKNSISLTPTFQKWRDFHPLMLR